MESLTKQYNKQFEILDKQQIQIENRGKDIRKAFKETSKTFSKFMKEPAPFIDGNL